MKRMLATALMVAVLLCGMGDVNIGRDRSVCKYDQKPVSIHEQS